MTPEKIQQELLELAMLEDDIKCNGWNHQTCENTATHLIICTCKVGREQMCGTCLEKAREYAAPIIFSFGRSKVWFADTCGHFAHFEDCSILPL